MKNLDRKIDLIIAVLTSEDEDSRKKAVECLKSLVAESEPVAPKFDIQEELESILRHIGVPCHIRGFYDIITAVQLVVEDPSYVYEITCRLYPDVAKIRGEGRTASRVERSIRHAIEVAWDRGDLDVLKDYFGNTVSRYKSKPTNSEFISNLAVHIRNRMNHK